MPNPLDRVRHAAGAIMHDGGSQGGWTVISESVQCVHCGAHITIVPGSGRERGFCRRCMGVVCGHKNCWACIPEEQMLLNWEATGKFRQEAATNDAEEVAELLHIEDGTTFAQLADKLYAARMRGVEYRERMDANIRAIRGSV